MLAHAGVRRDRAVAVWALEPLRGMGDKKGNKEQHDGEWTQRQPSHDTRGRGEVATVRRHIPDRGSKAGPDQQSHARLVRWPWGQCTPSSRERPSATPVTGR